MTMPARCPRAPALVGKRTCAMARVIGFYSEATGGNFGARHPIAVARDAQELYLEYPWLPLPACLWFRLERRAAVVQDEHSIAVYLRTRRIPAALRVEDRVSVAPNAAFLVPWSGS
jgi:hypothetical protein